jgi:hypothetical protein
MIGKSGTAGLGGGMSKARKRELDIVEEEVKTRHTTHWDLDYLPMAEIEKMYQRGEKGSNAKEASSRKRSGQPARYLVPVAVAAAIAMAAAGFFIFGYPG